MSNLNASPQTTTASRPGNGWGRWFLLALPLGWLWFQLISNLWPEWDTNPQYSYGLIVPILVAGLLLRRWTNKDTQGCDSCIPGAWFFAGLCAVLALLFLPTRLVEAATPEWRPIQWLLAIETIGLTLGAIYFAGGKSLLRKTAFPVLFFLVAIPWPTPVEQPIIQGLSRLNARLVIEVLGIVGVPAIQHGNVIEVSTGLVGINDACSGIRSFQSSLMIALFIGEFYFFTWGRRLVLLPVSFVIAMALNLCRASILTWLAAKKGMATIEHYHDQAGMTILLVCTAVLWSIGWLMSRKKVSPGSTAAPAGDSKAGANAAPAARPANRFAAALIIWVLMVETGVESWYHIREAKLKPGPAWTVAYPENDPTFKAVQPTEDEKLLLRFDESKQGRWLEPDGTLWQAFYFNWHPGRVAGYLAKRHTPDICMTASGVELTAGPKLKIINVHGVALPMRCYTFDTASGPLQVFQCHWEAGISPESYTANESSRFNLIRGIWAGRGNQGQKVLQIVVAGYRDADKAEQALERRLDTLIKVEPQP